MKFVLVNWQFDFQGAVGGVESFYAKLAQVLKANGHAVDYASYSVAARHADFGVPYDKLPFAEVEGSLLIDKYLADMYGNANDVVIVRDAGVGGFLKQGPKQICVFGNPYHTLYDALLSRNRTSKLAYYRYHDICTFLERQTAQWAIQNVALSNFMAKVEMASLGIKCDKVINNCVDAETFKPQEQAPLRSRYGIPRDRTVACWVGSWSAVKGIETILELTSRFKNIYWILVLKHRFWPIRVPMRLANKISPSLVSTGSTLMKRVYSLRNRNVRILTELQPQQLRDIYGLADFAVLPYLCEGNSHVALEACACDLPIVTTRTGLFWDFWDDRIGFSLGSQDVEEFSLAVQRMLERSEKFSPRNVVLEQKLDLKSWGVSWLDYLSQL